MKWYYWTKLKRSFWFWFVQRFAKNGDLGVHPINYSVEELAHTNKRYTLPLKRTDGVEVEKTAIDCNQRKQEILRKNQATKSSLAQIVHNECVSQWNTYEIRRHDYLLLSRVLVCEPFKMRCALHRAISCSNLVHSLLVAREHSSIVRLDASKAWTISMRFIWPSLYSAKANLLSRQYGQWEVF